MSITVARDCPICGSRPACPTFPYATQFNSASFYYLQCGKCNSVFVDPVPDAQTFAKMYAKSAYHDQNYSGDDAMQYSESARLLSKHLKPGSSVLDYGCGVGSFLKACAAEGLVPFGVEYDEEAAKFAAINANCEVLSVQALSKLTTHPSFDAVHMGDVLEHLPNPVAALHAILDLLKPGGVLFVEGPLEENTSPVIWAVRTFGAVKRLIKPMFVPMNAPTHLFRTNANAQKNFFTRVDPHLTWVHWQVYETGWPYASGGMLKSSIAALAVLMSGRNFAGAIFGNRFKAILIKS